MGYESNTGLGVYNHYNARNTESGVVSGGELHGQGGSTFDKVVYVTADDFGTDGTFDTQLVIPAGAIPIEAVFEVSEAITQTGGITSLTLNVGTNGSEGTNGFSISDAATSIAVVTEKDTSPAGTWAAALASDTTVGVSLVAGGGAITSVDGGKVKIIIRYTKV